MKTKREARRLGGIMGSWWVYEDSISACYYSGPRKLGYGMPFF
jgi:hypothetical protein